jgi:anaphase-promoting complex subunit 10
LVQVKVVENHQHGKDTHLRGLKIYARDEKVGKGGMEKVNAVLPDEEFVGRRKRVKNEIPASSMLTEPDWMREIEMR